MSWPTWLLEPPALAFESASKKFRNLFFQCSHKIILYKHHSCVLAWIVRRFLPIKSVGAHDHQISFTHFTFLKKCRASKMSMTRWTFDIQREKSRERRERESERMQNEKQNLKVGVNSTSIFRYLYVICNKYFAEMT